MPPAPGHSYGKGGAGEHVPEAGVERASLRSHLLPGWRVSPKGALRPARHGLRASAAGPLQGAPLGRRDDAPLRRVHTALCCFSQRCDSSTGYEVK